MIKKKKRGTGKNGGRHQKESDPSKPLKDIRQELFVQKYVKEPVGTSAAEAAGYSTKTARHQACRLLTKEYINNRIRYLASKETEKFNIKSEWVLTKLQTLATKGRNETTQIRALELLGKYFALFTEKIKHEGLPKRIVIRNEGGDIREEIK